MVDITTLQSNDNQDSNFFSWDDKTYDVVMNIVRKLVEEKGYMLDNIDDYEVYIGIRIKDGE